MGNKYRKYVCVKTLLMSDGKIGFMKGKVYLGKPSLSNSGSVSLMSELTIGVIHNMDKHYMDEYLHEFKFGK